MSCLKLGSLWMSDYAAPLAALHRHPKCLQRDGLVMRSPQIRMDSDVNHDNITPSTQGLELLNINKTPLLFSVTVASDRQIYLQVENSEGTPVFAKVCKVFLRNLANTLAEVSSISMSVCSMPVFAPGAAVAAGAVGADGAEGAGASREMPNRPENIKTSGRC